MPFAAVTCRFNHPQDQVWSALSDFATAPERISGITEIEMLRPVRSARARDSVSRAS